MKRKRIVGIIVLMLSLAVFCLAACQPQTREVEAAEPRANHLGSIGIDGARLGFSSRGRLYDKLYQCRQSRLRVVPWRRFILARFRVSTASALIKIWRPMDRNEGHMTA